MGGTQRSTAVARKDDAAKPQFSLFPPEVHKELAELYTLGAVKYDEHNYLKGNGLDYSRVADALQRHLNAWQLGEEFDPEDGQPHLISIMWCAATLRMYERHPEYYAGSDNRMHNWLKENHEGRA